MNSISSEQNSCNSSVAVCDLSREIEKLKLENKSLKSEISEIQEQHRATQESLTLLQKRLKKEIQKQRQSKDFFEHTINSLNQQKEDLEISIQILIEHADSLDEQWNQEVLRARYLAAIDPLTQLYNRRCFDQCLEQQWHWHACEHLPLALTIIDIDYFKQYNDTYGHLAGDDCLKKIARLFRKAIIPESGLLARYGGEEFVAILPKMELPNALDSARSLQMEVVKSQIPHLGSPTGYLTISIGVTGTIPSDAVSPLILFNQADRLLYRAKQQGRNQIVGEALLA